MSFRIEDKLFVKTENLFQFYNFLYKNSAKKIFETRKIKSLYFDNLKLEMYKDSIEGSVPRKKIRVREYPDAKDKKYYFELKTSSLE
jgi:SPX domain protein involved in polyphosphate accumulation